MEIASTDLAPIRELYGKSLYVSAQQYAARFGPVKEWSNASARLLGGRLAIQLGAPRLGRWLHLRAYRDTPSNHEAIYYHARFRLEQFGPLATWKFLRSYPDWNDCAPDVKADWYGLHGFVAARLRDFDRAERWLNKAESVSPERPWLCIERAAAYEFSERLEEALIAARRSLELHPTFRPGLQAEAHLLQLLHQEKEALDRLMEASPKIESGIIMAHLAGLQLDLGHYHDARKSYERYAELSPWMEEEVQKWLAARRADAAYFCGDWTVAIEQARQSQEDFYTDLADRLEQANNHPDPAPKTIDPNKPESSTERSVPSIQWPGIRLDREDTVRWMPEYRGSQTEIRLLDILARYWQVSTDSPAPMETGTYDGLPDAKERRWADEHGFIAIEFTLTPETAQALLDRKIPFLLTLVESGYNHSQIVLGYDRYRHSLWVRDVMDYRTSEAPFRNLFERYPSTGPRCLAILPKTMSKLIEDISFADRDILDQLYHLQLALLKQDRPTAAHAYQMLLQHWPGHRITRQGRVALARYDSNLSALLSALNDLLELFPTDATFLLSKISTLRDLGRKTERLALAMQQVALGEKGDPLFAQHAAQMMIADPAKHPEAIAILMRAIRKRPYSAGGYYILAGLLWEQRRHSEATDVYRFAAALDERDEQLSEGYFRAARVIEQTPEAMRFLQTRFLRCKGKWGAPARALFYALSEQEEMTSAFNVLEQFFRPFVESKEKAASLTETQRHEIGEVMLFTAEMKANYNDPLRAKEILQEAKPFALAISWYRSAARVSLLYAELIDTRHYWEMVLKEEPLASDIQRNLARVIADLEGREAAMSWVRHYADRFPYHLPLQQLLIDWFRADPASSDGSCESGPPAEPVLRRLIQQCPEDAWAHRELALHLVNYRRVEEALDLLETATKLDPDNPTNFYTKGHILQRADRMEEARMVYQQAIEQSVDNEVAITELVNLARGEEEKEEALNFVAEELQTQETFGDGILIFRDQAVMVLEAEDLLKIFAELNEDHPDLWQTWSTLIQQLGMLGRLDEALETAREAVARFPLLARLWLDLGDICQAMNDTEGQISALRKAVEVAPGWGYAARELAEALEANQQSDDARVVLEQAVARSPLDPVNHGYLADNLWNQGESAEAIDRLKIALKLDPGYEWAWRSLSDWSERAEMTGMAIETAREVTRLRPGDPRGWLALVRLLYAVEHNEEALHAIDRAIVLNPRGVEAYDLKAERLAEMGRFDEARVSAAPTVFENDPQPPVILQGRQAWVEARAGNYEKAIRQMQAILSLEKTYFWGWQQLAEWQNEVGNSEAYHEAASQMVELRPDSALAWTMRGEAKLQLRDRENGKKDLKEAMKLAPGYPVPALILFDAHLQDEDYREARTALALLQEHTTGSGRALVAFRYAQLAVRTNDQEAALDALREVCTIPSENQGPLISTVNELRRAGWSIEVDQVLSESWENEDGFHPWTLLLWLDGPEAQDSSLEKRMAVIDKVLQSHPRFILAHDRKAEILTMADRYTEALAACEPEIWGEHPPLFLQGRRAWILAQQGKRDEAISLMRSLVHQHPDYYWGWQKLALWYDEEDCNDELLEASEQLVRLDEQNPSSFVYRGRARLATNDRRGAKADFQRAYEMDPDNAMAGVHLVTEQMHDNELDAAANTLARLQEHADNPYVNHLAVRLACKQRDAETARKQFYELGRHTDTSYVFLYKSLEGMQEAGWGKIADEVLNNLIHEKDAICPWVGRLWVTRNASRTEFPIVTEIGKLLERGSLGREALHTAIELYASPNHVNTFLRLIQTYEEVLRSSDSGWSKVAEGLIDLKMYDRAEKWVADWKTRNPSEPWMLHPAALTYRLCGKEEICYEIASKALQLQREDHAVPDFRVWMAFEDVLAGKTMQASQKFQEIDAEDLGDETRILYALTEGLLQIQQTEAKDRSQKVQQVKQRVQETITDLAPKSANLNLHRSYKRWLSRVVQDVGGLGIRLWALLQRCSPPL